MLPEESPKDASPIYNLPCIYPKDKFDRGVGLNFAEEHEFRGICTIGTSQLISCYHWVNERFTIYDFMMGCCKCKYFAREYFYDKYNLIDAKSREIWHPDWLVQYMKENDLMPMHGSREKEYVYFISDQRNVKIGKARNVNNRLKELQIANSNKLELLFKIGCKNEDAAFIVEKRLHKIFFEYRKAGEWFDILDKLYLSVWQTMF